MRNPFRIRTSQRSTNDDEFVKLFGSGVLELVDTIKNPWDGLVFLRSAPGGGKTTFLRDLFSVGSWDDKNLRIDCRTAN